MWTTHTGPLLYPNDHDFRGAQFSRNEILSRDSAGMTEVQALDVAFSVLSDRNNLKNLAGDKFTVFCAETRPNSVVLNFTAQLGASSLYLNFAREGNGCKISISIDNHQNSNLGAKWEIQGDRTDLLARDFLENFQTRLNEFYRDQVAEQLSAYKNLPSVAFFSSSTEKSPGENFASGDSVDSPIVVASANSVGEFYRRFVAKIGSTTLTLTSYPSRRSDGYAGKIEGDIGNFSPSVALVAARGFTALPDFHLLRFIVPPVETVSGSEFYVGIDADRELGGNSDCSGSSIVLTQDCAGRLFRAFRTREKAMNKV